MRNKRPKADSISTFLGPDASVEGMLTFQGTIRLDGTIKGKITSSGGTVIVGEQAVVEAEIAVGAAVVMGKLTGTIAASDRIEVYPPGRITGDIQAPVIVIEEGGIFSGRCTMTPRTESLKKVKPIPEKTASDSQTIAN
ncbi:MAG: polymer-forming cytoskeletal protein [Deltaproteobacteria bacterium]|nr:polymer-forming cytoskeletal protein [Deltaproteobacteria bacterium]